VKRTEEVFVAEQDLVGKVAIVTGGASGIGRATALALAEHGASVVVFDQSRTHGSAVEEELRARGAPCGFVEIDLADADGIAPAVDDVVARFGRVDILVNSAGIRAVDPEKGRAGLFDLDVETWDLVQAVNLRAPFLLTQAVARHMVEQGDGGHVVNLSSSAAFQAKWCSMHYAASKAGLGSLTRTSAADLGRYGITVNAVAPGTTRTPMLQATVDDEQIERQVRKGPLSNLLGEVAEPEDIASIVLFLCLPASRQITGQVVQASAGFIV
jgi:NAD(P)-dependent dehydrogenase (short-subunit alcohol dehydrogenase family)